MKYVCPECGTGRAGPGPCANDQTPVAATDDDLIGTVIGSYRVTGILGVGGMGRVYRAVHPTIGSRVAVKVLLRQSDELVHRFFAEARAANVIRHEHIVNVLDLATLPDGRPYIIMEYLDGEPLSARLAREGRLSVADIGKIFGQLLSALAAAHAHRVVHRDLKPDNVFLTPSGNVKVLDFGIAKLDPGDLVGGGGGAGTPTRTGMILGTPLYASPEQAQAKPADGRSDLYSLGVMMYQAATGRPPFDANALFELLRQHVEEAPTPVRVLRPDLPAALDAVIARALEKDPARRFQSADEMAAALASATGVARGGGPSAPTGPSLRQVHTTLFGRPFPWPAVIGAVVIAAAGVGGYYAVRAVRAADTESAAPVPTPAVVDVPTVASPQPPPVAELNNPQAKLAVYIECLNGGTAGERNTRSWYLAWANARSGPTGREQNIYGVKGDPKGLASCSERIRAAAFTPPSLPAVENEARRYADAEFTLAQVEAVATPYYENGDYKDDHMQKGRELHPQLMAAWEALERADGPFRERVRDLHRQVLETSVTRTVVGERRHEYWMRRLLLAAEPLVASTQVRAAAVTKLDLATLTPLFETFDRALTDLDGYLGNQKTGAGQDDTFLPGVASTGRELQKSVKELMRHVRDRRGYDGFALEHLNAELIDGSPGQVADRYNKFVFEAGRWVGPSLTFFVTK